MAGGMTLAYVCSRSCGAPGIAVTMGRLPIPVAQIAQAVLPERPETPDSSG